MKIFFGFVYLLSSSVIGWAQGFAFAGSWAGGLEREGSIQPIEVQFAYMQDVLTGRYFIGPQCIYDSPVVLDSITDQSIIADFGYGRFKLHVIGSSDIHGYTTDEVETPTLLHLRRVPASDIFNVNSEDVVFDNGDVRLSGTLLLPNTKDYPLVVLIHGSGPADRNESYYRSQAIHLVRNGIGVLFYDKRGCGSSSGNWEVSALTDLAGDALAGVRYLRGRKDLQHHTIGLMGTSQGGWIAPIAANKDKGISFVVLNVGPAVSTFQQYEDFLQYFMTDNGVSQVHIDSLVLFSKTYFKSIYDPSFRPEALKLASRIERGKEWWRNFLPAYDEANTIWWRNNNYDPKEDLHNMKSPTLSILGTSDEMIPAQVNADLMLDYLHRPDGRNKVVVFDRMEHSGEIDDGYEVDPITGAKVWVWRHVAPGFYKTIIDWIKTKNIQG